jgi:7-carboxy-7-deazaguanine synthase
MRNFYLSEHPFYSLQGEGHYMGVPSVFIRFFGCNFECRGFGMPKGEKSHEPERIAANIDLYKEVEDIPLAKTGCDSFISWHPAYKKFRKQYNAESVYKHIMSIIPEGTRPHIIFTGGEPLMQQKAICELIQWLTNEGFIHYTFETNASKALTQDFMECIADTDAEITFSMSPKLACSGEAKDEAFRPDYVAKYMPYADIMYFKFVVWTDEDMQEVEEWVNGYREAGVKKAAVFLMPEGGTPEAFAKNAKYVAAKALERGWKYSDRLQVSLFGNSWAS